MSSATSPSSTQLLPKVHLFGRRDDGLTLLLRSDPVGTTDFPAISSHVIGIHLGLASKISCRRGGYRHSGTAVHGDIDIIPAQTSSRWEIADSNDTALILGIPSSILNSVAEEYGFDSRLVELRNRFQVRDPQIENICWALRAEMESGCPSGRLFTDSLAVSVTSRLLFSHSSLTLPSQEKPRGLRGQRLKQVLSYIEEHLAQDIPLAKIASIAGLSSSHLKTLFRESTGQPVHQYVIRRRLERARALLAENKLPIAQIALATGFSHQSHLARHMRRVFGASPRDLQQSFFNNDPNSYQ